MNNISSDHNSVVCIKKTKKFKYLEAAEFIKKINCGATFGLEKSELKAFIEENKKSLEKEAESQHDDYFKWKDLRDCTTTAFRGFFNPHILAKL